MTGTTPCAGLLSDSAGMYFCSTRRLVSLGMPLCPRPFPLILIVSFSKTRRVRMKVDTLGSPSQTISLESQPKMRCLVRHTYKSALLVTSAVRNQSCCSTEIEWSHCLHIAMLCRKGKKTFVPIATEYREKVFQVLCG